MNATQTLQFLRQKGGSMVIENDTINDNDPIWFEKIQELLDEDYIKAIQYTGKGKHYHAVVEYYNSCDRLSQPSLKLIYKEIIDKLSLQKLSEKGILESKLQNINRFFNKYSLANERD